MDLRSEAAPTHTDLPAADDRAVAAVRVADLEDTIQRLDRERTRRINLTYHLMAFSGFMTLVLDPSGFVPPLLIAVGVAAAGVMLAIRQHYTPRIAEAREELDRMDADVGTDGAADPHRALHRAPHRAPEAGMAEPEGHR